MVYLAAVIISYINQHHIPLFGGEMLTVHSVKHFTVQYHGKLQPLVPVPRHLSNPVFRKKVGPRQSALRYFNDFLEVPHSHFSFLFSYMSIIVIKMFQVQ